MRTRFFVAITMTSLLLAACGSDDKTSSSTAASSASVASGDSTPASSDIGVPAGDPAACATGKTLAEGKLTIATGEPAFSPWVEDDDPASGKGFEAAVALAVAEKMGFTGDAVTWIRTTFDEAIQPGKKNFDFNLQQYSITPEREANITFSDPYYTATQALVTFADSPLAAATSVADLKDATLGAAAGTTSLATIETVIKPSSEALVYDTNEDAKAALEAKQIDGIIVDLPTAYFIAFAELTNGTVVGQFFADPSLAGDQFGMVLDKGNALVSCINGALGQLSEAGTLEDLEATWLAGSTGVPVFVAG
jgi:polar amino acid transport system substrate-binding protein